MSKCIYVYIFRGRRRHSHHLGHHRSASNLDEDDVVETDTVERVQEGEAALDLVRLDHGLENIAHQDRLALTGEMIGDGEDGTEVV